MKSSPLRQLPRRLLKNISHLFPAAPASLLPKFVPLHDSEAARKYPGTLKKIFAENNYHAD